MHRGEDDSHLRAAFNLNCLRLFPPSLHVKRSSGNANPFVLYGRLGCASDCGNHPRPIRTAQFGISYRA
jgi:hypothetical protein